MHQSFNGAQPLSSGLHQCQQAACITLMARYLCQALLSKHNMSWLLQVLAYGQTGSGKTFSMGSAAEPSQLNGRSKPYGVIPRALVTLFEGLQQLQPDYEVASKVLHLAPSFSELSSLLLDMLPDAVSISSSLALKAFVLPATLRSASR